MGYDYVYETIEQDGLIIQIVADPQPFDPRENDNLGIMLCWHPDYVLGDEQFRHPLTGRGAIDRGKEPADIGDASTMDEVAKFIRYQRHGRHIIPLYLYDHSGISISAGAQIGRKVPWIDGHNVNPWDSAGWDTSAVGFIFTTKERMELIGVTERMVTAETEDIPFLRGHVKGRVNNVEAQLRAEVREYNDFLTGNAWGYVITKPCPQRDEHSTPEGIASCSHSETLDSCWGFIGDPKYAMEEALGVIKSLAVPA